LEVSLRVRLLPLHGLAIKSRNNRALILTDVRK
jgi:hypothetical protein